ncbi:hypothetical protein B0H13DRAFT_2300504 [Mycena leptocephala]|nr:hypothetical protein B0H13DRAFT_2300504 [Mycena leptocephala]
MLQPCCAAEVTEGAQHPSRLMLPAATIRTASLFVMWIVGIGLKIYKMSEALRGGSVAPFSL